MKSLKIYMLLIVLILAQISKGQQKYALIFNAHPPTATGSENSWAMANPSVEPYDEFWNDVYLMWELLYQRGFQDDNIYVLYYDGEDYPVNDPEYNERYTAGNYLLNRITDYRAQKSALDSVFTGLAQGINGFPKILEDDYFVLYTFGHGYISGLIPDQLSPYSPGVSWGMLNNYLLQLNCHKKLVIMQQCFSGSSIDSLKNANTIILTAANDSMPAHAVESLYYDDIDYPGDPNPGNSFTAYEREIYPSDTTKEYGHGEFNLHLLNAIRRIDPGNQSDYYQTGDQNFLLSNADGNSDNYTSLDEAYNWIINYDSRMTPDGDIDWDDPQLSDLGSISAYTSIMYPTLLHTDITTNQTHRGLIGVSKEIHITTGNTLTFHENAVVDILNESKIVVDAGASLVIQDNVTINGGDSNEIIVNGIIQIGENITFNRLGTSGYFSGLMLYNDDLQLNINDASFYYTYLHNYGKELSISNTLFDHCETLHSYNGDITVTNSTFTETSLYIEDLVVNSIFSPSVAHVHNCVFNGNGNTQSAISITDYLNFFIEENTINGYARGIHLAHSGEGISGNQLIKNNDISGCEYSGILVYNSTVSIENNYLYNNRFGIRLFDNSNVALYGDPQSANYDDINHITNNSSYELFASRYSFPWYFRNNALIDEDNMGAPTDPLIYHSVDPFSNPRKDVKYNCWGNNFDPVEDFYPGGYIWNPVWCPGGSSVETEIAEQLMIDGVEHFENESYVEAETSFKFLIEHYPSTIYAGGAMKALFSLEKFAANDYGSLKSYFETNDSIQRDSSLSKIAIFLANKCEIAQQNWQSAIDHFESIIDAPDTAEDSIFAIIDLGHTYLLMESSGDRSVAQGEKTEYIPVSIQAYNKNRDALLALLPFDKNGKKERIKETHKHAELLQNNPNPFSGTTTIDYQLKHSGLVTIEIYNYSGKKLKIINEGIKKTGMNKLELKMEAVEPGMYFYSIFVNSELADTKKMTIIY